MSHIAFKNFATQLLAGLRVGVLLIGSLATHAAELSVAVATNFLPAMRQISESYQVSRDVEVRISSGSTGKLYAQLLHGVNHDVFLAADEQHVDDLIKAQLAHIETRFIYAVGRIAFWAPDKYIDARSTRELLNEDDQFRIAIPNPRLAPYGIAALQTLENLNLAKRIHDRVVMGENVGQTYAMVATNNARAGFVAVANLAMDPSVPESEYWLVPKRLHTPINQAAVQLVRSQHPDTAQDFLAFLRAKPTRIVIERYGYSVP